MSYRSIVFDGLYVIVWGDKPEVEDVARFASEIRRVHQLQGVRPMGLGIVPESSGEPGQQFILASAAIVPELVKDLDCGSIVFRGTGVRAVMKRTAFAAMTLIVRIPCPIYVRSSVEDALIARPPSRVRFDPLEVIIKLSQQGVE